MRAMESYADWLAFLDYGTFEVAEDGRRIPIRGYAVGAGDHVVLVDTGFPRAYAVDAERAGRADGLGTFGRVVELTPDQLPDAQLALLGLAPEDVTGLVVTHGDIDHVGCIGDFPAATIVTSRVEREAGPPRYFGGVRPMSWPVSARYLLVDSDLDLAPGVRLLSTPGHSPGHLSLIVRLRDSGTVVLAGDAIARPAELESGVNGGASDPEEARRSAARLVALAREEDALLVYGHDPEQRETPEKAPHVYR